MSAEYTSPKPDGYLNTRNEVYRDREKKMQVQTKKELDVLSNMPAQSKENYGKKK